jgi:NAD-dependent deacetylase
MATKELQNVTKKKLVVLSGAGISAESGVATFRVSNGLWEGYKVMEVASPEGWAKDYSTVLEFYNARRRNIASVLPNKAHKLSAEMEKEWEVSVITQNIDNLHEQAGSTQVILYTEKSPRRAVVMKRDMLSIWVLVIYWKGMYVKKAII